MANPEHVAKLLEGVDAWGLWRVGPAIAVDLSDADFSGKNLRGASLREVDLSRAGCPILTLRK